MIESQKSNFERSVLVGIINDSQNEEKLNEFLEELEFLSLTAGGTVVKKFTQKINTPNQKPLLVKEKLRKFKNM
jgi:GTP-binding protein HflX